MNSVGVIEVRLAANPYVAVVGEGMLGEAGREIRARAKLAGRCAVLCDATVQKLHGEALLASLRSDGIEPVEIPIPPGESSKSLEIVASCCERMVAAGLDRKSFAIAFGGGVAGDIAGFVAAVFYRGIPFVQIPTTVVAQVDSSVGGKTGVNLANGKNLVGSFHQPALVIVDPLLLQTLPEREYREGFAEVIKHGIIADAEMLGDLPEPGNRSGLAALIARNIAIKARIVEEDERETTGRRALLNFGHTVGHAIEKVAGYGTYFHGEAISLGMAAALELSRRHAGLSGEEVEQVLRILKKWNLPVDLRDAPETEAILAAMRADKKFERGQIRFVLTKRLGSAFVEAGLSEEDIRAVLVEARR